MKNENETTQEKFLKDILTDEQNCVYINTETDDDYKKLVLNMVKLNHVDCIVEDAVYKLSDHGKKMLEKVIQRSRVKTKINKDQSN